MKTRIGMMLALTAAMGVGASCVVLADPVPGINRAASPLVKTGNTVSCPTCSVSSVLQVTTAATASVNAVETTLDTITLPVGALTSNNAISVLGMGGFRGSASAKTAAFYVGSQKVASFDALGVTSTTSDFYFKATIIRKGANRQKVFVQYNSVGPAIGLNPAGAASVRSGWYDLTQATDAAALTVKITGTGTVTGDVVGQFLAASSGGGGGVGGSSGAVSDPLVVNGWSPNSATATISARRLALKTASGTSSGSIAMQAGEVTLASSGSGSSVVLANTSLTMAVGGGSDVEIIENLGGVEVTSDVFVDGALDVGNDLSVGGGLTVGGKTVPTLTPFSVSATFGPSALVVGQSTTTTADPGIGTIPDTAVCLTSNVRSGIASSVNSITCEPFGAGSALILFRFTCGIAAGCASPGTKTVTGLYYFP